MRSEGSILFLKAGIAFRRSGGGERPDERIRCLRGLKYAEELGFEFITADARFYRKVGEKVKPEAPIKLLADLKAG